jgi:hypothetical protein
VAEDELSWEELAQSLTEREALSLDGRAKALVNVASIRARLGDECVGRLPVLAAAARNHAPWTLQQLDWFANSIELAATSRNFAALRDMLLRPSESESAFAVLEVADPFLRSGSSVQFEPPGHGKRRADLLVTSRNSREAVCVEVTAQRSMRSFADLIDHMMAVSACLTAHAPRHSFRYITYPREVKRTDGVVEIEADLRCALDSAADRLRRSREPQEVVVADRFEFVIANECKAIAAWNTSRGVAENQCLTGPEFEQDTARRLLLAVSKKVEQLPGDSPGIVVVFSAAWCSTDGDTAGARLREWTTQFRNTFDENEHLAQIWIVNGGRCDDVPRSKCFGRSARIVAAPVALWPRECLVLLNPHSNGRRTSPILVRAMRAALHGR